MTRPAPYRSGRRANGPSRGWRRPLFCLAILTALGQVLLDAAPVQAATPTEANLFLWQVVGPSDTTSSPDYLAGTIHLGLPPDRTLPQKAVNCLAQCSDFVMEADLNAIRPESLAPYLYRQDGKSNQAFLTPTAWRDTIEKAKGAGFDAAQVSRMAPWFLTTFLSIGPNDPSRSRDVLLCRAAEKQHLSVSYLEKAEDQLHMMLGLPAPYFYAQIEALDTAVAKIKQLANAYDGGNLAALEAETFDPADMKQFPLVYQQLFFDRNNRWMPVVDQLFQTRRAFVAVGLGHLIGEKGLIHQLTAKGYRITPLLPTTSTR